MAVFLRVVVLGFIVAGTASSGSAQAARAVRYRDTLVTDASGLLRMVPDHPGELRWYFDLAADPVVHVTPVDSIGSLLDLGIGGAFLASGANTSTGRGFLVAGLLVPPSGTQQATITVLETKDLGTGIDPWQVAYDRVGKHLFLRTPEGDLHVRSWGGIGHVLPAFSAASKILDAGEVEQLGNDTYELVVDGDKEGAVLASAYAPLGTGNIPRIGIRLVEGSWQGVSETVFNIDTLHTPGYQVRGTGGVSVSGPISLKGPAGPFEILELDTGILLPGGSLSSPSDWWEADDSDDTTWVLHYPTPDELVPGVRYRIEGVGTSWKSPIFTPLLRYGEPTRQVLPGGVIGLGYGAVSPKELFVGNQRFVVLGELLSDHDAGDLGLDYHLVLAVVPPGHSPPLMEVSGVTLLSPGEFALGPRSVQMRGFVPQMDPMFNVPVPDDDNLAGNVLFAQFVVFLEGGRSIVSEVFGAPIRAPETSESTVAVKASYRDRSVLTQERRRDAAQRFAAGLPPRTRPLTGAVLAELHAATVRALRK